MYSNRVTALVKYDDQSDFSLANFLSLLDVFLITIVNDSLMSRCRKTALYILEMYVYTLHDRGKGDTPIMMHLSRSPFHTLLTLEILLLSLSIDIEAAESLLRRNLQEVCTWTLRMWTYRKGQKQLCSFSLWKRCSRCN